MAITKGRQVASKAAKQEVVELGKPAFSLPDKVVYIKPVFENAGWIKDPRHSAFFKIEGTHDYFTVPKLRNNQYKNLLTDDEKEYLEKTLGLEENELSIYRKKDNYWSNYIVKIGKDGVRLDLSDPTQFIDYKVYLSNTSYICPNFENRTTKATFKYYVEDQESVFRSRKRTADIKLSAYKEYGKMEDEASKLAAFLKVYGLVTKNSVNGSLNDSDMKLEFLQSEVLKLVEEKTQLFVELIEDPNYSVRLLIAQGIESGAILKDGNKFYTAGKDVYLGTGLRETITFLNMVGNQEILLTIEARIKATKK